MTQPTLTCRIAGRNDLQLLAHMRWLLAGDDAPITDQAGFDAFVEAFAADQAPCMKRREVFHWIVEADEVAAGAMSVVIVDKLPSPREAEGRLGYLTNCYVYPDARNAGVGKALLQAVEHWAREVGLELLVVWPGERAYPFYERAGFRRARDPLVLTLAPGG